MTLSPKEGQGATVSIPSRLPGPSSWQQFWRGVHERVHRLLGLKPHPPLAIPFLGLRPVFEIKPRGLGLRGKPVPPDGFEQVERTR